MKARTSLQVSHREYRRFVRNAAGIRLQLPVIVTDHGVLEPFARYIFSRRSMSRSWQDAATFSVQLLLEYVEANFDAVRSPRETFQAFADALHTGTVEDYDDPSGLWWLPRMHKDSNTIIGHITQFSEWLSASAGSTSLQLNPWRQATTHEQRLDWAAYCHKRDNAFLAHLWRGQFMSGQSREIRKKSLPVNRLGPAKSFPEDEFEIFCSDGFRRKAKDGRGDVDLRNKMISYLMQYGGLRLCEALSLWPEDVTYEDGEVVVRIYHPQNGLSPDETSNRAAYLLRKYGLQPRNTLVKATDPKFLGWKNPCITDPVRNCFEVFFYPYEKGTEFANMWRDYFSLQRVKPSSLERHPYAFTNKDGQPYTHRMFRKAHRLASKRRKLLVSKLMGNTPHGHRHAYGQRLARDGASPLLIMFAMHHTSIESSKVYTEPSSTVMRKEMRDMEARLATKHIGNFI
ncbi:gamma-mobile-trio recombinase GmtY [Pseudomonas aeruginosa]